MTITLTLALFGLQLATFDVRIDIDTPAVAAVQPVVDSAVKRMSRRWVRHMAS